MYGLAEVKTRSTGSITYFKAQEIPSVKDLRIRRGIIRNTPVNNRIITVPAVRAMPAFSQGDVS
jgi:hypothetical protein